MPKSPKGPPPDKDDDWNDDHARTAYADTPILFKNILILTKDRDNRIVTLLEIVDYKGVQTYLIETVDGLWIKVHRHNLAQPEDPDIAAIPMSASEYVCKSCHIRKD